MLSGTSSLIARKAGFRELGDLADLGLHYPTSAIGTTKSYLQKNEGLVKEFMLAYIEAIHDFKRNKETALTVLKKYTRNDDREVLEDSYSQCRKQISGFADSDNRGDTDDSDGTFKHGAGGEERRSGTIRLVQDRPGDRGERVCQTALRERPARAQVTSQPSSPFMTAIRLGLHLHPPPRQSLEAFVDTVKRADRYGFARLGTGDTQWHAMECFTTLTLMALNSEKAEIGPRVTNPVTREPSVMASAIASLEIISQGRPCSALAEAIARCITSG